MANRYVFSLSKRRLSPYVGSKAASIHFLSRQGFNVPISWVITWTAYEDNLRGSNTTRLTIRKELEGITDPQKSYAVRSSASVEDSEEFSCAGLFKSYLQIQGAENIMECISNVWSSLESPEFAAYCKHNMPRDLDPRMAVIVQEMVQPLFSGVVFTKNPVSGFSETIIEAGKGTGEFQAESHQEPERWVSKWGNWSQKPDEGLLKEELARKIVSQATEISERFGRPIDLEWAWDGEELFFLQVRPITRLNIPVYSNRIAREMLPGIIKPLVWSVNTSLINPVWAHILTRLTGERSWDPHSFTGHYYYRAYFNMSVFGKAFERLGMPAEALELLFGLEQDGPDKPKMKPGLGIVPRLPGLISFSISFVGIHNRLNRLVKDKRPVYERLAERMEGGLDSAEYLQLAQQIFNETKDVAYYNIMIPLLAMMHHRLFSSLMAKHGYDVRSIELRGAREAAVQYNPQHRLKSLHETYFGGQGIDSEDPVLSPEMEELLEHDINGFLKEFGHLSDSGNDCSRIPWRESPNLVRRMIVQQKIDNGEQETQSFKDLKLPKLSGILLGSVFRGTSRFVVDRERISSLYTYGYGQFRTCFVKLGESLVQQGLIHDKEDIYYLYWPELLALVDTQYPDPQHDLVSSRKQDIELYREAFLPDIILGNDQPPIMKAMEGALRGIPTSLGTYTGPARVVHGIEDFDGIQEGDVLIVPFADVGWTPLFAKAGAVVSESGGILSHTSIVAREYRIPAVVSVSGACTIKDGCRITVNGYNGDITLSIEGSDM